MRDWVKPMLKNDAIQLLGSLANSNLKEEDRKELFNSKLDEIEHAGEKEIFYELTDYFQIDFGRELGGATQLMTTAFGSVLSDLPEMMVFKKLSEMKNVFFIFNEFGWGTVKKLNFDEPMEEIHIVVFDNVSSSMPFIALRGMIAHEIAHVYLGHTFGTEEIEDRTDKLAIEWGFEAEIKALREYFAELKKEQEIGETDS